MPKVSRYLPPVISVFLLVVGVFAGVFLVQNPQELRERAAPATTVFISPATQSKKANEPISFSVLLNTGVNQVVGMDLAISFDPRVLSITSMSKGVGISSFDTVVKNTVDNTNGVISYSLFSIDKTKAVAGSDIVVLDVAAQVKSTVPVGTYSITVSPVTSIAALSEGQNVVVSRVPGTLQIVTADSSSSVSEVPTEALSQNTNGGHSNSDRRGDVNNDGKVNVLDLSVLLSHFLKSPAASDLNGDGKTNILDLSILLSSWNK